jgi:hypothetical protein
MVLTATWVHISQKSKIGKKACLTLYQKMNIRQNISPLGKIFYNKVESPPTCVADPDPHYFLKLDPDTH